MTVCHQKFEMTVCHRKFEMTAVIKIHKNLAIRFSSTFMTAGSWKITKISRSLFHQFSWPRGHENSQKSGGQFLKWPCATGNLKWPCATENLRWPCATKIWEKLEPMNKNDFEIYSPKIIFLTWKVKKLGKTCTVRLPVRPLCAHWGLSCVPFCAMRSLCAPFCATLWETHCFDRCFT